VRINEIMLEKSSGWERHFARAQEITVVMVKMRIRNWHFVRSEHFRASHLGLKRKNQK
jgi:predicted Fe-Mo cluster-binding NifX family protein